jgi:hypothetical protein
MESAEQLKIQNLKDEMEKTREIINKWSLELENYECLLFEMENEMRKTCDHKWVIDEQEFDIHSRSYVCSRCGLGY